MADVELGKFSLERMFRAVELVQERLLRAAAALESGGIPYAVVGGCAVAEWVTRAGQGGVRYSNDVDILIRRNDLPRAQVALECVGFVHRSSKERHVFLDGVDGSARSGVKIVFAGEPERPDYAYPVADVIHSERGQGFQVLSLEPLVRMALTSFRREDGMLLRDMLDVGLMDESWLVKLPEDLAARLKELIDTPDG
jgi:hypothetical protein